MDERGTPSYTPAEEQQVPPTQYAAPEQPQYTAPAEQPQYTAPQYAAPQYTAPAEQPQYAAPQYQQYQQPQYTAPQYQQYQQYQQQPQYTAQPGAQYQYNAQPGGQYQYNPQAGGQYQYNPQYQQGQYAPQQPQYAAVQQPRVKNNRVQPSGGSHSGGPNLPKWLIPAAAGAVALIAVIVLVVSLISGGSPSSKVPDAAMNTLNGLKDNELIQVVEDTAKSGSVAVSFDLTDALGQVTGMSMTAEGSMKLYFDTEESKTAFEVSAEVMDMAIDAAAYINMEEIALASDWLLGGEAYGLNFKNIEKNLEDSVFGPDGPYYIGDEAYDMIEAMLASADSNTKAAENLYEDGYALAEKYVKLVVKSAFKHGESETESDEIKIGGEKVKVKAISLKIDAVAMMNIAEDLLKEVEGDKKLEKFLTAVVDFLSDNAELAELYDIDVDELEDMIDEMYDSIDEALDSIDEAKEEAEDVDMAIKMEFYLKGSDLLGLKYDDGSNKLKLLIGPDPSSPNEITLTMEDYYGTSTISYQVEENSDELFEASFAMDNYGYDVAAVTIVYDKEEGEWDLSVFDGYQTIQLSGAMEVEKDVYTVTFSSLTVDGYAPEGVDLIMQAVTLTIDTDDDVPKTPDYTDVLTLDEDEIMAVVEEIYTIVEDLMYMSY